MCTHVHTTHTYMHTYTHTRVHAYMDTCAHIRSCTHVHAHTHTHKQMLTCTHVRTCTFARVCTNTCKSTHTHTPTYTPTHTFTHTSRCSYARMHTRTHTRAHTLENPCTCMWLSSSPTDLTCDKKQTRCAHVRRRCRFHGTILRGPETGLIITLIMNISSSPGETQRAMLLQR